MKGHILTGVSEEEHVFVCLHFDFAVIIFLIIIFCVAIAISESSCQNVEFIVIFIAIIKI